MCRQHYGRNSLIHLRSGTAVEKCKLDRLRPKRIITTKLKRNDPSAANDTVLRILLYNLRKCYDQHSKSKRDSCVLDDLFGSLFILCSVFRGSLRCLLN